MNEQDIKNAIGASGRIMGHLQARLMMSDLEDISEWDRSYLDDLAKSMGYRIERIEPAPETTPEIEAAE